MKELGAAVQKSVVLREKSYRLVVGGSAGVSVLQNSSSLEKLLLSVIFALSYCLRSLCVLNCQTVISVFKEAPMIWQDINVKIFILKV